MKRKKRISNSTVAGSMPTLDEIALHRLYTEYLERAQPILTQIREIMSQYGYRVVITTSPEGYFDFTIERNKPNRL